MKKMIFILAICVFQISLKAQTEGSVSELTASVFSSNFSEAKTKLLGFINQHKVNLILQNETDKQMHISIFLNQVDFNELSLFISQLGFVSNKNISTASNFDRLEKIKLEKEYISNQNNAFNTELKTMTSKDERYYNYWKEIRDNEKKVFDLNSELQTLLKSTGFKADITIYDDVTDLTSDIAWVNMPGVSYDHLWIESPLKGTSAATYKGVHLKYLFTRGKTYATVGTFRSPTADSAQIGELFTISFGQDFYTKHFGRGKNKWFNLYSGYEIGGLYATSDQSSRAMFTAQVFTGLEIYKNKYFLMDNKVGYFIPISNLNRNLRGIVYSVSLNFVL